jgi:hypothetical protein
MKPTASTPSNNPSPFGLSDSEWRAILQKIFFHTDLESTLDTRRTSMIEALGQMEVLDTITRTSLSPPPVPEVMPTAPATQAAPENVPAYRARPHTPLPQPPAQGYRTARREYQSALGNQGLIEALLRYHRRAERPGTRSPMSTKGSAGFASERIPEVQTEAKDARFRRAAGTAVPVLRTKKEP